MELLLKAIKEEHGKAFWDKSEAEQLYFIAEYSWLLTGAIESVNKFLNK